MSAYDDDLTEAARRYHLTWCNHPHCVHTPFDTDREHVAPILGIAEAVYAQRDLLVAACQGLLAVVSSLERDLERVDALRARLASAHGVVSEALA